MGINPNALRCLAREFKNGSDLDQTVMIGRQGVHVPKSQIEHILNVEFKLGIPPDKIAAAHDAKFAEELLTLLGAGEVHSFDYSDYEGATHVHDFNTPIPDCHKNKYTFLIDGGTLEHVFQFPTALKNCMEMLKVGGTYFGVTPTNNEMGHGFYQLSPELYFRAFSEPNGFRTDAVYLYEGRESTRWLKVADPETTRRRAEKVNCKPTYLLVRATKTAEADIFATPPLQPDYVSAWNVEDDQHKSDAEDAEQNKSAIRSLASKLPHGVKRSITMAQVAFRKRTNRIAVHFGLNPDPEIFQRFDPRNE
jgi:hypothetical protein